MERFIPCTCAIFTVLLMSIAQYQEVEGVLWVQGTIAKHKTMDEIVSRLDELHLIPSDNRTRMNEIIEIINVINVKIDKISKRISKNRKTMKTSTSNYKTSVILDSKKRVFQKNVNELKFKHRIVKKMALDIKKYENSTKKAFALWNVTPSSYSVDSKLFDAFFLYFGYPNKGESGSAVIDNIALEFEYSKLINSCSTISFQWFFFNDYWEMTILAIQGYLINKLSWTILSDLGVKDFMGAEEAFWVEHEKRVLYMSDKLATVTAKTTRDLRRCDPAEWIETKNYEQFTRLIQGYIVNEVNIGKNRTCKNTCAQQNNKYIHDCYEKDQYCQGDSASGKILRCESGPINNHFSVCLSDNPARRYEYFKQNKHHYGKRMLCSNTESPANSWTRGFVKCSYCFCYLDEKSEKSDRFFNIRKVVSDTDKNKVVTGVRFVKRNRIMYLQIQQGELASFGMIRNKTLEWKDVDEYQLLRENENIDYVTLDSEKRSVNLDDIEIDEPEYVVTGVKLSRPRFHVYLEVQVTKYDFVLGKLIDPQSTSKWISSNMNHERKIMLGGTKISTRYPENSRPSLGNVVDFTHSDKKDDASQTTLPFLDTRDVVSQFASPLSGVGLYHKGFPGYGGFIAPKIFTIDLSHFV